MSLSPIEPLPTHVAHNGFGLNRFFGFDVPDLAGDETFAGLAGLAVTGRRFSPEERGMLDDVAVASSLADPRIWPLKMARLVSSYGGCLPGVAVGFLCAEGAVVGFWTAERAAELLLSLLSEVEEPTVEAVIASLDRRLRAGEWLSGFGVPFRPQDERLLVLRKRVTERKRDTLPAWRMMEAAGEAARKLKGVEPNITVGLAAVCLDLGLTPRQIGILCVTLAQVDYLANAVEGAEQSPAILRRLPVGRMRYVGRPPRQTPRASQASSHGGDSDDG
jgi:hypothetical protein